ASQHAGSSDGEGMGLIYRKNIKPALPAPTARPVVDIGCGQGDLVRLLQADGYPAEGIDISPEQVAMARRAGLSAVRLGDYRELLAARPAAFAAVTATDVLEHLPKPDVLDTFDRVAEALVPGGVFIARVPNAASPFAGRIRHGDFTHESWYTARSVRQLAAASGFQSVTIASCSPVAHGVVSAGRLVIWTGISAFLRLALAAETGSVSGHVVTQNLTFAARKAG
ncbi:MAG: class I SAM-dependent methyltransferase, partial [Streptosporangiales bacterium]